MKLESAPISRPKAEALLLFVFEEQPAGPWNRVDPQLEEKYKEQVRLEAFKAKVGSTLTFHAGRRVIVAGLGKKADFSPETLRRAVSAGIARARTAVQTLDLLLPEATRELAHAAGESVVLSTYRFDKYKSNSDEKTKLTVVRFLGEDPAAVKAGLHTGEVYARAACLTRDLVNEPAGFMTPKRLAEEARRVAMAGRLKIRVFDEKQIEKMGMGAFRAVSLGSHQPPRFVHMTYTTPGAKKTVCLVGKGITFDSGGLCLKPADGMLDMKSDMAGAAAVIGVMSALKDLKPKMNVHGIFPATENMPGGGAYKQRDVLRCMNGKTIEVTNTDAEGRLILSDALAYASRLRPDAIIDMATLTGACVVALGPKISGLFTPDDGLAGALLEAGRKEGEKLWRMPLEDEYFEDMMKSEIADMKNSGGRWGGAITAACFLKQFVEPGIPWAHIDIAGPAIFDSAKHYNPPGASGVIVRTLLRYLESQQQ